MTQTPITATDSTFPPDGYGRGAWTRYGMPLQATNGLYRYFTTGKVIGSEPTKSLSHKAVNAGARALQGLLNEAGYRNQYGTTIVLDGTLGAGTASAIKWAQTKYGLTADGVAGQATLKVLLNPGMKVAEAAEKIPNRLVYGLTAQESAFDPGAIGYTTPSDHGLVQINLAAHANITFEEAMEPAYALGYAAHRMRLAFDKYKSWGCADVLSWDCAIAQHNSPMLADEWARTGVAPLVATRKEGQQIADYVAKVRGFAATAPA